MVRGKIFLMLLLMFSLLVSNFVFADLECGGSISSYEVLDHDLTGCSSAGLYILSGGSLDCQGNTISGSGTSSGILVTSADNANIINCNVEGFIHGIYITGSNNVLVEGGSYSSNEYGLNSYWNNDNLFVNDVDFYDNSDGDIYIEESLSGLTITNSMMMSSQPLYQIYVPDDSNNILIEENQFYNAGEDHSSYGNAIYFDQRVSSAVVKDNYFENVGRGVVSYNNPGELTVSSNDFVDIGNRGVYLSNNDGGTFTIDTNTFVWENVESSDAIYIHNNDLGSGDGLVVSNNYIVGANRGIVMGEYSGESEGWVFDSNVVINSTYAYYTSSQGDSDLTFTSNYFCSSEEYDFYCDSIGTGNSGSGNFMDTSYSCTLETESESMCSGDVCTGEYIIPTCHEDTDGGLVLEDYGSLEDESGNTIARDECVGGNYLLETYCDGSEPKALVYECAEGCGGDMGGPYCVDSDGNPSSSGVLVGDIGGDTDGDDPTEDGVCGNREFNLDDNCIDDEYLLEGYCSSGVIEAIYYQCDDSETFQFPTDFFTDTYTCSESSHQGCKDGVDNDLDGLIDCQQDSCNLKQCNSEDNSYACIDYECVQVELPEAELATVVVQETFSGYLWSYSDFFSWINSATVYHETGICSEICANYGQECLFADAGRSICSAESSEKCTCI